MASEPIGLGDLAAVAEGAESATLVRRAGGGDATPTAAVRIAMSVAEAAPSGGAVIRADADWLVELPAGGVPIEVGDVLRDAAGERWTVLAVRYVAALNRFRCSTRNLRVAFGLNDRVDVLHPQWLDSGGGPEIVGWDYVVAAQPVRLQPLAATLDESVSPPVAVARFTATFAELLPIEPGDRLATDDGERYVVERIEQAERMDALPMATVVRETT